MPVALGIAVYESLESEEVARTGEIPVPQEGEELLGGHAILAVGYDDEKELVIISQLVGERLGRCRLRLFAL
jgi:C1A family cysteine protease